MKTNLLLLKEYSASGSATSGITAYSGKERKTKIKARRGSGTQMSRVRATTRQLKV